MQKTALTKNIDKDVTNRLKVIFSSDTYFKKDKLLPRWAPLEQYLVQIGLITSFFFFNLKQFSR